MKSNTRIIVVSFIIFLCCIGKSTFAQLSTFSSTNYVQLINSFVTSSVTVSNISYTGSISACGFFSNGNSTNLGTDSGIILSTGFVNDIASGVAFSGDNNMGTAGNSFLDVLSGTTTYDAAVLEFDVVPTYDTLSFSYIFASEDYPEWVGGNPLYQDYIGAFITGTNPSGGNYSNQNFVFVPNTSLPIIVNNINASSNSQYFVDNASGSFMFDGFTTLLQDQIAVVPFSTYHLTIGIADAGDHSIDSGFFLKGHSLLSHGNNTGIAALDDQEIFQFYPNPAKDKIIFNTTEKGTLTIKNQLGQLIENISIIDNQTQIEMRNFQSGIYLMSFQTENYVMSRKLIVQN